jgi:hypothetical protein
MCLETPAADLDAGPGFAAYSWRDDGDQVVGTAQMLAVDGAACGRTYSVEVFNAGGCSATTNIVVNCTTCAPPEVSPAGSPVPLRMGVDALGTLEFELLPDPGVVYHLYHATDMVSFLAGDWTNKFCDLAAGAFGTWAPVDATTVRWTPALPQLIFEGHWVVVAENLGVEGPYGVMSGGTPRPADLDGAGSGGNIGCP